MEGEPVSDLFSHAEARAARDLGLSKAGRHAGRFAENAYAAIKAVAERQATVHIDDVLRLGLATPHHPNAWGAVWMKAIRDKLIERTVETRPCTLDRKKHAHRYPVYRSLIRRGEP